MTNAEHLNLIDTISLARYDQAPYRVNVYRVQGSPYAHIVTDRSTWKRKVSPVVYGDLGSGRWVDNHLISPGY